jgi:hypothetical protein
MAEATKGPAHSLTSAKLLPNWRASLGVWRKANPNLGADQRTQLVKQLMDARGALRGDRPEAVRSAARKAVDDAKVALGERRPVWWKDGASDYNRKMTTNTPCVQWLAALRDNK